MARAAVSRAFQRMVSPSLWGRGCRGPLGSAPARARSGAGGATAVVRRTGLSARESAKAAIQASDGVPVDGDLVGGVRADVVDVAGGRGAARQVLLGDRVLQAGVGAAGQRAGRRARQRGVELVGPDAGGAGCGWPVRRSR